jgi:hypothetical protein
MAATAATLYLMAGALAWYRLCRPKKPAAMLHVRSVILDRALAWSSLAVIFYSITAIKLGWYHWSDNYVDIVRLVALATIFVCGLVSIRAMTIRHFGYNAVKWFALLSLASGVVVFISF